MRILHVIPSVAEVRGGTSKAVLDMVSALQTYGLDVTIATTNDSGPTLLDVPLMRRVQYEGVPVYFFERFSPSVGAVREFAFSGQLTRWLWRHMADYDLVHVHAIFCYASTVAMAVARAKGLPYIVTPHGMLCEWSLQQGTRKKELYLNLIERANLNQAQVLHFTDQQEAREAKHLRLTNPEFVLPLGLTIPELIPSARQRLHQILDIPQDEPVILFMSRLHLKKGLDYLIPALGQINERCFTFVIAGSGSAAYEQQVQQLLVNAGLKAKTRCIGFVRGEQKDLLLQGADILALTSHSENFGIVVLEALAAGTPVLITPGVPLVSVVAEHDLGYVVDLDVHSITTAIRHALDHRATLATAASRYRQFIIEHYSWQYIATEMITVYETILRQM